MPIVLRRVLLILLLCTLPALAVAQSTRIRDLGLDPGIFNPGPLNAITDVSGVQV